MLDLKAAAIRQAGRKPNARALAKELRKAAGLQRRAALQAATNYLAGRPPDRWIVQLIRSTRGWRGVMAFLGMAGAGLVIWCFVAGLGSANYPWWFLILLLGLVGVNLLAWVLEPAAKIEFLNCAECGWLRLADEKGPCPSCGSRHYRMPRMSKVALGAISVVFVGIAVVGLIAAVQDRHKFVPYLLDTIGWLVMAALVVAGAYGVRVNKFLRHFNKFEFDQDFVRLSRHPYLARRILILIASIGAITLAILRLLSQ